MERKDARIELDSKGIKTVLLSFPVESSLNASIYLRAIRYVPGSVLVVEIADAIVFIATASASAILTFA